MNHFKKSISISLITLLLTATHLLADNKIPLTKEAKAPFPAAILREGYNYEAPKEEFEVSVIKALEENYKLTSRQREVLQPTGSGNFIYRFNKAFETRDLLDAASMIRHFDGNVLQPQTRDFGTLWSKYKLLTIDQNSVVTIAKDKFTEPKEYTKLPPAYFCKKYSTHRMPLLEPNGRSPGEVIVNCYQTYRAKSEECSEKTFGNAIAVDSLSCEISAIKEYAIKNSTNDGALINSKKTN